MSTQATENAPFQLPGLPGLYRKRDLLLRFPNVVLTPSSAWNTADSSRRGLITSIDNVLAFMAGKPASLTNAAAVGRA